MSADFSHLHDLIAADCGNICGLELRQQGRTLYSDHWHGFKPTDAVNVMSVTKSVVSLLVGIALDQGLIRDIRQPVLDFFPDHTPKRGEKTLQHITVEHLLTMTAPYKGRSEPWSRICSGDDWTRGALDILGGRSGISGEFRYHTLGVQVLMGIIARSSAMPTIDFANRYLFQPLGIAEHRNFEAETAAEHKEFTLSKLPRENVWFADPQGVNTAGWGLCASAADLARLGQLCLDGGLCDGQRLVSAQWIADCTQPRYHCDERFDNMYYGMLWWIPDASRPAYAAIGNSGNVIYVDPARRAVVAITALFAPRVFDRIHFIEEQLLPLLD